MVQASKGGMPAFVSILGMSTWEVISDYQAELTGGIHPCVLDTELWPGNSSECLGSRHRPARAAENVQMHN